jgi:predicted nuclease of predicted toxin-antitoxin system
VLTHNLDFSAILVVTQGKKPSLIQIRARNITSETVGKVIISALHHSRVEFKAGALLTVDADRTRIRLLPLRLHP